MQNLNMKADKVRIKQACETFGLSESFMRHMLMERKIPFYKLGSATFVSLSEIDSIISAGRIDAVN